MDAHFNAYKVKYDLLDQMFNAVGRTQYIHSIDIFINLDDLAHILHRPIVEKEFELCGVNAPKQCAANILNVVAHYKQWAAKRQYPCTIYLIYTHQRTGFKNQTYIPMYRHYHAVINDPDEPKFYLLNHALEKAYQIAKIICDYVPDVHMIDSCHLEPSIIPWFLKSSKLANHNWSLMLSRDHYDLQYAYRDKWSFISPKGENTVMVSRANLWHYLGDREHIELSDYHVGMYHHDVYPMALTVAGNKLRSIPRLRRIGWKTIFKYLNAITEKETVSGVVVANRFLELLQDKGVDAEVILNNSLATSITDQVGAMSPINQTMIQSQLKHVADMDALAEMNNLYFSEFPINLQFLTANYRPVGPFTF